MTFRPKTAHSSWCRDRFFSQGFPLLFGWRTRSWLSGYPDSFHSSAEQAPTHSATRCDPRNRVSAYLYSLWGVYEVLPDQYASALPLGIWLLGLMDTENGPSFSPLRSELQCLWQGLPDTGHPITHLGRKDPCQSWYGCFAKGDVFGVGREQNLPDLR